MRIPFFLFCILLMSYSAYSQKNMQFRSNKAYPARLSGIWGYSDSLGNEYALVGVFNGTSIVDVTNPDSIHELFFVPGPESNWREIKTWNKHAYVNNETSGGLQIINLEHLPDSIQTSWWTANDFLNTAHTHYIDEKGFVYVFGFNDVAKTIPTSEKGALIADLNPDPENPVFVGHYKAAYVHDGFVRGDTMWTAEIQNGRFAVVDVSDKANPVVLAARETSGRTTHNCWLTDDGKTLFTTDETRSGFVDAYDVSDLNNIRETDRFQVEPASGVIPHNTYAINNFVVTAYYKYGVNIADATYPDNLVEIGYYDTSPFISSDGYAGCWGAYPYLPSGTILAADMETGLFVLTPNYVRASYLEGKITQQSNGASVIDAFIEIMTTGTFSNSNLTGDYKTGVMDEGLYDIRITKLGCLPKIVPGVNLQSGIITTLNVALTCTTFTGINEASGKYGIKLSASPTVFSNSTSIYFGFANQSVYKDAYLKIFDVNGKQIYSLLLDIAEGELEWGESYPSGVYFVQVSNSSQVKSLKLVKGY